MGLCNDRKSKPVVNLGQFDMDGRRIRHFPDCNFQISERVIPAIHLHENGSSSIQETREPWVFGQCFIDHYESTIQITLFFIVSQDPCQIVQDHSEFRVDRHSTFKMKMLAAFDEVRPVFRSLLLGEERADEERRAGDVREVITRAAAPR